MKIEKLKKILNYSYRNRLKIEEKVHSFYWEQGLDENSVLLNPVQMIRSYMNQEGYLFLQLPFKDEEIGGAIYKGDFQNYAVINSSIPRANMNFAAGHELYHVLFSSSSEQPRIEFSVEQYLEEDDELAANLFAGILLMPETSFRKMYLRFNRESNGKLYQTIIRMMSYYQVPYTAVLIRCYELRLPGFQIIEKSLLNPSTDELRAAFNALWLDESLLKPTYSSDYNKIQELLEKTAEDLIELGLLNKNSSRSAFRNVQEISRLLLENQQ